ncbi:acid protease [Zopfia rhizophila CBS 207.26]|uniref:Acid protease n=1 Tax=Zopfia rhizophila CBS 207.26 TaxID=1314779 RepID=A0A6A6EAU3_9PEZI|nr:acid protease [Zopfia rhizophila CBS 207.26]
MSFQPRSENTTTILLPVQVIPSGTFDGNDGKWSTFTINIGNDQSGFAGQDFKILISTSSSLTQVPMQAEWCSKPSKEKCAANRGIQTFQSRQSLGFDPLLSKNWQQAGPHDIPLPQELDWTPDQHPNASYGTDAVGLGSSSLASPTLTQQLVAQFKSQNFFMGSFGLSATPVNLGTGPVAPFLVNFREFNNTPSLSYGYTAGAHYRNNSKGIPGSLILGGFDRSRFSIQGTSIPMPSTSNSSLVVGVQSIDYSPDRDVESNVLSLMNDSKGFLATIDSTLPYLWLPQAICDKFEETFNLEWDSEKKLYMVSEESHNYNVRQNATVSFKLGSSVSSKDSTSITLPYDAFDLEVSFPISKNTTNLKYFPIKRSPTGVYVLGRTLLQEAYLIVDYERNNFTVAPANYSDPMPDPNIVTISSKSYIPPKASETPKSSDGGLVPGAIAGIAVGVVLAFLLALLAAFLFWKKRHAKKLQHKSDEKTSYDIDTIVTGEQLKERRVSELDSNAPGSPKPSTLGGYYGDRDQKDVIPFPPINEMESPPEIVELESPPIDGGYLSAATPPHSELADYFTARVRRRGATRESSGNNTPGPGPHELPGDDGKFQVGGQHFEPVVSPVHSRGPSDASQTNGIDTMISEPDPSSPRSPASPVNHTRGPSDATVQSESTAVSEPTQEQLEAWALAHNEPRRPLSE